jgi:hypothetical protein
MKRWILVIAILAAGMCFAVEESPLNVDVFFGWDGCYKPAEWTPVEINISSRFKEPFAGRITLTAQQDGLNRLSVSHDFVLTPQMPLHLPLSTKLDYAAENCEVRISDAQGRTAWRQEIHLWDYAQKSKALTTIKSCDVLIGVVGRSKMGLLSLPDKTAVMSDEGVGEVYVKNKLTRVMPWDWTGYVCLDVLVLYDLQWDSLLAQQWKALTEWVSNGGRLFLITGGNPIPSECPLMTMLPLKIESQREIQLDEAMLSTWTDSQLSGGTITAWPMTLYPGAQTWTIEQNSAGQGIFASGWAGFGKVGVLSFDPDLMPDQMKTGSEKLWVYWLGRMLEQPMREYFQKSLDKKNTDNGMPGNMPKYSPREDRFLSPKKLMCKEALPESEDKNPGSYNQYNYHVDAGVLAANQVMEFLYNIPQMRPLSVWWVILLLTLLALLLGPVDYLVLKKMDKLPWTWITCAFWILIFSVGAYYGVQALRSGQMQIRAVSVADGIADGSCWNTSYSGIFSPGSDSYQLTELKRSQWWSAASPTREYVYFRSQKTAIRTLYCMQHDGGNLPYEVPIHIWTMQSLVLEEPTDGLPMDTKVVLTGDQVHLSVANRGLQAIEKGVVLFKDGRGFSFGRVKGTSSETFDGRLEKITSWLDMQQFQRSGQQHYYSNPDGYHDPSNYIASACWAKGSCQRNEAMMAYLNAGAAIVCAVYESPPIPFGIKNQTYEEKHIQIVRQVIFPENQ